MIHAPSLRQLERNNYLEENWPKILDTISDNTKNKILKIIGERKGKEYLNIEDFLNSGDYNITSFQDFFSDKKSNNKDNITNLTLFEKLEIFSVLNNQFLKDKLISTNKESSQNILYYPLSTLSGFAKVGLISDEFINEFLKNSKVPTSEIKNKDKCFELVDFSTVVERQSYKEQAITELVANGIDSYLTSGERGRFGIGALSNLQKKKGDSFKIFSKSINKQAFNATFVGNNHNYFFNGGKLENSDYETKMEEYCKKFGIKKVIDTGTIVEVKKKLNTKEQEAFLNELKRKFSSTLGSIILVSNNDKIEEINGIHNLQEIDSFEIIEKNKNKIVLIDINENGYSVLDFGKGITPEVLLKKFIVPGLGDKDFIKKDVEDFGYNNKRPKFYFDKNVNQEFSSPLLTLQIANINSDSYNLDNERMNYASHFQTITLPSTLEFTESGNFITKKKGNNAEIAFRDLIYYISEYGIKGIKYYNVLAEMIRQIIGKEVRTDEGMFALSLRNYIKEIIQKLPKDNIIFLPNKKEYANIKLTNTKKELIYLDESLFDFYPDEIGKKIENFNGHSIKKALAVPFKKEKGKYTPIYFINKEKQTLFIDEDVIKDLDNNERLALINILINPIDTSYDGDKCSKEANNGSFSIIKKIPQISKDQFTPNNVLDKNDVLTQKNTGDNQLKINTKLYLIDGIRNNMIGNNMMKGDTSDRGDRESVKLDIKKIDYEDKIKEEVYIKAFNEGVLRNGIFYNNKSPYRDKEKEIYNILDFYAKSDDISIKKGILRCIWNIVAQFNEKTPIQILDTFKVLTKDPNNEIQYDVNYCCREIIIRLEKNSPEFLYEIINKHVNNENKFINIISNEALLLFLRFKNRDIPNEIFETFLRFLQEENPEIHTVICHTIEDIVNHLQKNTPKELIVIINKILEGNYNNYSKILSNVTLIKYLFFNNKDIPNELYNNLIEFGLDTVNHDNSLNKCNEIIKLYKEKNPPKIYEVIDKITEYSKFESYIFEVIIYNFKKQLPKEYVKLLSKNFYTFSPTVKDCIKSYLETFDIYFENIILKLIFSNELPNEYKNKIYNTLEGKDLPKNNSDLLNFKILLKRLDFSPEILGILENDSEEERYYEELNMFKHNEINFFDNNEEVENFSESYSKFNQLLQDLNLKFNDKFYFYSFIQLIKNGNKKLFDKMKISPFYQAILYFECQDEFEFLEKYEQKLKQFSDIEKIDFIRIFKDLKDKTQNKDSLVNNIIMLLHTPKISAEVVADLNQPFNNRSVSVKQIIDYLIDSEKSDIQIKNREKISELNTFLPVSQIIGHYNKNDAKNLNKPLDVNDIQNIQENVIKKAIYSQSPESSIFIRELFQNALDALSKIDGKNKRIDIDIYGERENLKENFCVFEIKDSGKGMDEETIYKYLLQPHRRDPSKVMDVNQEGEIGWGFWSIFTVAEELDIVSIKNGKETKMRITPVFDKEKKVKDVLITNKEEKTLNQDAKTGTTFKIKFTSDLPLPWKKIMYENAVSKYGRLLSDQINVFICEKKLDTAQKKQIGEMDYMFENQEKGLKSGKLKIFYTDHSKDGYERVTRREMTFTEISNNQLNLLRFVHPLIIDAIRSSGKDIQIDIPENINLTRIRGVMACSEVEKEKLQKAVAIIIIKDTAKQYSEGKIKLTFLSDDAFYDIRYYQDNEVLNDISNMSSLSDIDTVLFDKYCSERIDYLKHLIMNIPFDGDKTLNKLRSELIRNIKEKKDIKDLKIPETVKTEARCFFDKIGEENKLKNKFINENDEKYQEHFDLLSKIIKCTKLKNLRYKIMIPELNSYYINNIINISLKSNKPSTWNETEWIKNIDTIVHECTHFIEDSLKNGELENISELLKFLGLEGKTEKEVRAAFLLPGKNNIYIGTHSESEKTLFGFAYKRLCEIILKELVLKNIIATIA